MTKEPIEKEAEPKFPAPVGPDSADSTPTESRSSLLAAPEIAELLGLIKALARCRPKDNAETMQAFSVVLSDLAEQLALAAGHDRGSMPLEDYLRKVERQEIVQALEATGNNKTAAARLLDITFRALRYKLEQHGID